MNAQPKQQTGEIGCGQTGTVVFSMTVECRENSYNVTIDAESVNNQRHLGDDLVLDVSDNNGQPWLFRSRGDFFKRSLRGISITLTPVTAFCLKGSVQASGTASSDDGQLMFAFTVDCLHGGKLDYDSSKSSLPSGYTITQLPSEGNTLTFIVGSPKGSKDVSYQIDGKPLFSDGSYWYVTVTTVAPGT